MEGGANVTFRLCFWNMEDGIGIVFLALWPVCCQSCRCVTVHICWLQVFRIVCVIARTCVSKSVTLVERQGQMSDVETNADCLSQVNL